MSMRWLCAVLGPACLVAGLTVGCEKMSAGTAIRPRVPASSTTSSAAPAIPGSVADVPGIETTLPDHIPPNALACYPPPTGTGNATVAAASDPAAPRITISVPDGWSSAAGTGDTALTLAGPDGMTGTVTMTDTRILTPAAAFLRYAADLRASKPGVQFTVAPAQFCGYSSQKLTGTFQGPSGASAFADRITHIWTNTKAYLVAIHVEGPAGVAGFDAAKTALMQDFAVVIP
jgi:hypothetical protein